MYLIISLVRWLPRIRCSRAFSATVVAASHDADAQQVSPTVTAASPPKHGKRRVALVCGYDGTYFHGSQMNDAATRDGGVEMPTVEHSILAALDAAKLLGDARNGEHVRKVGWTRASRTDRGVHSIGNVFAVKLRVPADVFEQNQHSAALVHAINAKLPPTIRVFSAVRVSYGFSAYSDAVARVYHYYLPTEAVFAGGRVDADAAAALAKLNTTLAQFVGTHSFHNFTAPRLRSSAIVAVGAGADALWAAARLRPGGGMPPPDPNAAASAGYVRIPLRQRSGGSAAPDYDGDGDDAFPLENSLRHAPANVRGGSETVTSATMNTTVRRPLRMSNETKVGVNPVVAIGADSIPASAAHSDMLGFVDQVVSTTGRPPWSAHSSAVDGRPGWHWDNPFTRLYNSIVGGDLCSVSSMLPTTTKVMPASKWTDFRSWRIDGSLTRTIYACSADIVHAEIDDAMQPLDRCNSSAALSTVRNLDVFDAATSESTVKSGASGVAAQLTQAQTEPSMGTQLGTAASPTLPSQRPKLLRITIRGSGFMYNQIRYMIGAAIGVHSGALPPDAISSALMLPIVPPMPRAPSDGLVLGEVHYAANAFVSWRHPPGIADDAPPVPGYALREAHLDDPSHVAPIEAATYSADAALLTSAAAMMRAAFFREMLLPRVLSFTAPSGPALAWIDGLPYDCTPPVVANAVSTFAAAMRPSFEAHAAMREAADNAAREAALLRVYAAAESRWNAVHVGSTRDAADRGQSPPRRPRAIRVPIHLENMQRPSDSELSASSCDGAMWDPALLDVITLAEVAQVLLPRGFVTALAIALGGTMRHADLLDIARAVAWRVAEGTWPSVASARLHAEWVVATGAALLAREGRLLYPLERAGSRRSLHEAKAVAHHQYGNGDRRLSSRQRDAALTAPTATGRCDGSLPSHFGFVTGEAMPGPQKL